MNTWFPEGLGGVRSLSATARVLYHISPYRTGARTAVTVIFEPDSSLPVPSSIRASVVTANAVVEGLFV